MQKRLIAYTHIRIYIKTTICILILRIDIDTMRLLHVSYIHILYTYPCTLARFNMTICHYIPMMPTPIGLCAYTPIRIYTCTLYACTTI